MLLLLLHVSIVCLLSVSSVSSQERGIPLYVLNQVLLLDAADDQTDSHRSPTTTPDYAAISQSFRLAEQVMVATAVRENMEAELASAGHSDYRTKNDFTSSWLSLEVQVPVFVLLFIVFVGLVVVFVKKYYVTKAISGQSSLEALEAGGGEEAEDRQKNIYTISLENPGFIHSHEDISEVRVSPEPGSASTPPYVASKNTSALCPEICQPSRSLYI